MNTKLFLNKVMAILIVLALTMADFLIVTVNTVTYAVDVVRTNSSNVELSAYFMNANGEKLDKIERDINANDLELFVDISVKNEGYFNGEITLENSNFNLKQEVTGPEISSISGNKVMLNQINAGSTVTLKLGIEAIKDNIIDRTMLSCESNIMLSGTYVISSNRDNTREISIEGKDKVQVEWISNNNTQAELSQELLTNSIYEVNGESKRVLQLLVKSKITDNNYPVKSTVLNLNVPKDVEEVKVHARNNSATNGNIIFGENNYKYDEAKSTLTITVDNKNEKNISWNKNVQDVFVITYIFPLDVEINNTKITTNSTIETYDEKTLNATQDLVVTENKDGIVSYEIESNETSIYKGKIYTQEERNYVTKTAINVDYLGVVNNIDIRENVSQFLRGEEKFSSNNTYKQTKINKQEFLKIFGDQGVITIKDQNGIVRANITNDTEADENGNIIVDYVDGVSSIEITTSKPIQIGTLNVENTKNILANGYSREDITSFAEMEESLIAKYNDKEIVSASSEIELKNTSSSAKLSVSTDALSTIESNENIKITATLLQNSEDKDLYQNPIVRITLPKQVTDVTAKCKVLYGNGLSLQNASIETIGENKVIDISLQGEQLTYNTEAVEGTTIIIYANLDVDKLATSSEENITLEYRNEKAQSYSDNAMQTSKINIIATSGVITTNNVSEYGIETIGNKGTENVGLAINTEPKEATVNISAINNEGTNIKDVKLLGRFPTKGTDNLGVSLTSGINTQNATVYYSEKEDANANLQDASNGWTREGNLNTAKSYLIVTDNIDMGEKIEASYTVGIPGNLDYNLKAEEGYEVSYVNGISSLLKTEQATTLNLTTGEGPDIEMTTKATVGEEIVGEGKENPDSTGANVISGEIIKYEVTLTNKGNKEATNVQIKEEKPEETTYMEFKKSEEQDDGMGEAITNIVENPEFNGITTIDKIDVGETKVVTLYLRAEKTDNDKSIVNKIEVDYNEKSEIQYITNTIKNSNVSVLLQPSNAISNEDILKANEDYEFTLTIQNTSENEKISNVDIKFEENDLFEITKIKYANMTDVSAEDENIEEKEFENTNQITLDEITDFKDITVYVKAKNPSANNNIAELSAEVTQNDVSVRSNKISKTIKGLNVSVGLRANNEGEAIQVGQEISYNIQVTNAKDSIDIENLQIVDYLNNIPEVNSIEINGEQLAEEDYVTSINDDEEENNNNESYGYKLILNTPIKAGEELNVVINTDVPSELVNSEDTQISNRATVIVDNTVVGNTDTISHTLKANQPTSKGDGEEVPREEEPSENEPTEPGNTSTTPEGQPSQTPQGQTPTQSTQKVYTISGTCWLDQNENGQRDFSEQLMKEVPVLLMNTQTNSIAKDINGKELTTSTDSTGYYSFSQIPEGKYLVVFEYDTEKYILTKYQADGVAENKNSDIEQSRVVINGKDITAGMSDTIEITNMSKSNIDAGLVEAKIFDLELTKTVTKITVNNQEGTKTFNYDDATLSKVEVAAKHLQGTTVAIEYKIKVKNTGEVAGYVRNIVDYKPTDLSFNSSLNSDWYQSENYLYNTSLANTKLEAGETRELTLVLTKAMTETNTGLVNNTAELQEIYNNLSIADQDSTPGNRQKGEDDMGSSDVIISVKTGAAVSYVALTISIIIIIAIGAFMVCRKIFKKEIEF